MSRLFPGRNFLYGLEIHSTVAIYGHSTTVVCPMDGNRLCMAVKGCGNVAGQYYDSCYQ